MKNNMIELPLAASASQLWRQYLEKVALQIRNLLPKISTKELNVFLSIDSCKDSSAGFTGDSDCITIDDGHAEDSKSKRVFINFSSTSGSKSFPCIEFLIGYFDDNNFKYPSISEVKFSAEILGHEDFYRHLISFLENGKLSSQSYIYFCKNKFRIE